MGKRLAIAGYQNSGKSYPRRWIPDGENVALLQPSLKFPYLFYGPKKAHELTPAELDAAVDAGTRKMVPDFDIVSPEGKYASLQEAFRLLPNKTAASQPLDILKNLNTNKAEGYFKREHIKGNVFNVTSFNQLKDAMHFVNKHMPWIHTVILPDFTHFVTKVITSEEFLNRKFGNDAFGRYLDLAADSFKAFINESDILRKDLVVVTEFHVEFKEQEGFYELFVPGGKMMRDKFLPSSYYDVFLFTDVDYADASDEAEPIYRYVTRKTRKYPEARCMGMFKDLYIDNNLQEALTAFRKNYGIPVQYEAKIKAVA